MRNFTFNGGYTHAGIFHADDVFSTALCRLLNPEFVVSRVFRVPEEMEPNYIVYDIGGGSFDHHQKGAPIREDGVPYAAFGLLWREYGRELCSSDRAWESIEVRLVKGIDALDNGYAEGFISDAMSVSTLISQFNPDWDSTQKADEAFNDAVEFATGILSRILKSEASKDQAAEIVQTAITEAVEKGNRYIVLPRFAPWQEYVLEDPRTSEMLYVIFPSNRGGYNIQAIPVELGSFETRKPFPEAWRGKGEQDLPDGMSFCHPNGFLAAVDTLDTATEIVRQLCLTKRN